MKAVVCRASAPYRELPLEDVAPPTLRPGCVRIGTHTAGVSFATSLVTEGRYQRKPPFPFSPGTEVAGEVLEVAADVTGFAPGDRVCAAVDWGGHAEEVVTPASTVHRLPDRLPYELAPQFPISYATAHAALRWSAQLTAADTLLVHGAAGAVGLAAVELGKTIGARVIATASTEAKLAVAREHGADAGVLFPSRDALESIRSIANGGVTCVLDTVGGDAFDLSLRAVGEGGRILVIGFAGGRIQQIPANILLVKNIAVLGFNYGKYIGWGLIDERDKYETRVRAQFAEMFRWYDEGRLKPTTSHAFPLAQYRDAMTAVLDRRSLGKVILRMPRAR